MALTAKQEAFAQGLADGLSQAAAYRAVYAPDNMLASPLVAGAARLAANPNVSAMARELKAALAAAVTTAAAWTLDRQVEESAVNLAGARGDRQWAAANGALTTIGKLTGVLIDRHEVSGHVGHSLDAATDEMLRELVDRRRALEAPPSGLVIDGAASLVDAEAEGDS